MRPTKAAKYGAGLRRNLAASGALIAATTVLAVTGLPVAAADAPTIHIVQLDGGYSGKTFTDYLKDRAAAFEKLHPNVVIDLATFSGDYTQAALSMIASGSQLDVMESTHSFMALAGRGLLLDLAPLLRSDGVDPNDDLVPAALQVLGDGKHLWGLPSQIYHVGAIFNRTLFEEAGVQTPDRMGDGWNWDALKSIAPKLTRAGADGAASQVGVMFSPSLINLDGPVHQAGGMFYDRYLNPTKAQFDSSAVREGLDFLVSLRRSGFAASFSEGAFFQKRAAAVTLYGVSSYFTDLSKTGDTFGAVVQPRGPVAGGGETYFGPYSILASTQHPREVYEWVRFLALDDESQAKMFTVTGRLPVYLPTLRRFSTLTGSIVDAKQRDFLAAFAAVSSSPDNFPHYLTEAEGAIAKVFNPSLADVLAGKLSTQQMLAELQPKAQAELDRVNGK